MPRPVFWVLFVPVMLWIVLCVILGLSIIVTGRQDNPSQSDVIVVLGAGLEMDQPTANFRDRAKHGATMWHAGWAPNVLCTGAVTGIDDTRSEASACREMLLAEGVTAEAIFMEEKSRSTEENAIYSAEMMTAQGWQSALVVSSSYHLFRACWLFEMQGVQVTTSPAPAPDMPLHDYLHSWDREIIALQWQWLKDRLSLPFTQVPLV